MHFEYSYFLFIAVHMITDHEKNETMFNEVHKGYLDEINVFKK